MTSPTQRTLAECRRRGWTAAVVEKWVPFPKPGHRVDLFGVIDVVAITQGGPNWPSCVNIVGIQACAGASHSTRRAKILAEPRMKQWCDAGGRLELWSWSKKGKRGKRKTWELRVERYEDMKR